MKIILPTSRLCTALLTLCLFVNNSRAQVADLSKAPVSVTLSNGYTFQIYGLASSGKSVFPQGAFSDESIRSLFTYPPIVETNWRPPEYRNDLFLICAPRPNFGLNMDDSIYCRWIDENGYEGLTVTRPTAWTGNFNGKTEVKSIVFNNYPGRSRIMKLRFFSRSGVMGEVTIKNPFLSEIKPWPETVLPQEQQFKDVKVNLLEATCEMGPAPKWMALDHGILKPWTELKLQVFTRGQVDTNWTFHSIGARDATGNTIGEIHLQGADRFRYYDLLWPVEPIRYRVGLIREDHFPPDEYVEIKGLSVPREVQTADDYSHNSDLAKINFQTNLLGTKIEFIGFEDDSPRFMSVYGYDWRSPYEKSLRESATVKGSVRGLVFKRYEEDIKAFLYDEKDGTQIVVVNASARGVSNIVNHFAAFIPETTKTVTLRIAVQKPFYAEFTTKPKLVGVPPEPLIK
jgi:hypothetical protein